MKKEKNELLKLVNINKTYKMSHEKIKAIDNVNLSLNSGELTLLELVDEGKMGMRPAVELSYLSPADQEILSKELYINDCTPSHDQAIRLRKYAETGELTKAVIELVVREEKPNQRERIHIRFDKVKDFIPKHVNPENAGDYIVEALQFYQKHQQQKRNKNVR